MVWRIIERALDLLRLHTNFNFIHHFIHKIFSAGDKACRTRVLKENTWLWSVPRLCVQVPPSWRTFWSKCSGLYTPSAEQNWTCRTRTLSAKTTPNSAGINYNNNNNNNKFREVTVTQLHHSELNLNFWRVSLFFLCPALCSVNSERISGRRRWLKPQTSYSTLLSRTTCGITSHAGSRTAAGVRELSVFLSSPFSLYQLGRMKTNTCFLWDVWSHTAA